MLRDGHGHVVDDGLELVEVQVLELERVDDDDGLALDAEGAVHHLGRVELQQGPVQLLAALLGRVQDLEPEGDDGARQRDREASVAVDLDQPDARLDGLVGQAGPQQDRTRCPRRSSCRERLVDPQDSGALRRIPTHRQSFVDMVPGNPPDALRSHQASAPRRDHHGRQRPLGSAPRASARRGAPPRRRRRARRRARRARDRPARADAVRLLGAELAAARPRRSRR